MRPSDPNGEIQHRQFAYGAHFAERRRDDEKLRDALYKMDEPSGSTLIHDQLLEKVEPFCRQAA